jgi:hypothetical protein
MMRTAAISTACCRVLAVHDRQNGENITQLALDLDSDLTGWDASG